MTPPDETNTSGEGPKLKETPYSASVWDLPLHHPGSPFQSSSVVDWVFSKDCGCGVRIKLYQTCCDDCKPNPDVIGG